MFNLKRIKYKTQEKIKKQAEVLIRRLIRLKCEANDYSRVREVEELKMFPYKPDWRKIYKEYEKIIIDIGAGHGEIVEFLSRKKDNLVISFEIRSRFYRMTRKRVRGRENAFVFKGDAYKELGNLFNFGSVYAINILFPDPWHKKRHVKRRPLVKENLKTMLKLLYPQGYILIATDHDEYYEFIKKQTKQLENVKIEFGKYVPQDHGLVPTHYFKKMKKGQYIKIYPIAYTS